jgi:catechol 2,3-dioxygenase-like lactoylglutathione lyase family enzyme
MDISDFPAPADGFVLTHTLIATDVKRSQDWYETMLDGKVVMESTPEGTPCIMKAANSWLIINVGGGEPTEDKPATSVRVKEDHDVLSSFLNIRVADIASFYEERLRRGAEFLTEPKDRGAEIRCYMRDPDGYLVEVGQATFRS